MSSQSKNRYASVLLASLLLCCQNALLVPAYGQVAPASLTPVSRNVALDLGSTDRSKQAGVLPGFRPVNINVGGQVKSLTPTTSLTPAEAAAAYQSINSGRQSLVIGGAGNAVGGTMVLGNGLSNALSSLTVPQGVTVKVTALGPVNISGALLNSGVLTGNSLAFNAQTITNQSRGVISSALNLALNGSQSVINNFLIN
jgi:hypothetical protein